MPKLLRPKYLLPAAIFTTLLVSSPTRAEIKFNFSPVVTAVLPDDASLSSGGIGIIATGKLGFGYGALIGVQFSPFWGLETGIVHLVRNYTETGEFMNVPFSLDVNTEVYHFPVGIRIYLGKLLSLQAGVYFDSSVASGSGSNYGVQGGARLSLPLTQTLSIFAEARHNQGLKDQGGFKSSDVALALAGVTFGAQNK